MRAVCVLFVVLAAGLAGCSDGPNDSSTTGSDEPEVADILLDLRSPRSREDEVEYSIRVTDPSGRIQNGTVGTSFQSYVNGIPTDEWPIEVSGDVHESDPSNLTPYPFMLFNDTAYNGTWVIEIERTRDESAFAIAGQDPFDPRACMYIRVSKPDGVMTFADSEVHVATHETDGVSHATIRVHYPTATYEVERFPDDDVNPSCQPR